jgi:MFS family permease
VVNFIDRQVVNIIAEPVKHELGLADWQIGFLSGLAFAVFYTVLGIPIARLAERGHRPWIIGAATGIWSLFTVASGLAGSFVQLAIARTGVGVGEAGCVPPSHSLISDYVPKAKRASALAFYSMGVPIGGLIGLGLGGLIADAYGWRAAFLAAGVPGLLLAALSATTLREPRRALGHEVRRQRADSSTLRETLAVLRRKPTFWLMAFGASAKTFMAYGHAPFVAAFFLRNHKAEIAAFAASFHVHPVGFLGVALGVMGGVAGAAGSYLGGLIADRMAARDIRHYMTTPAIGAALQVPVYLLAMTTPSAALGLVLVAINGFLAPLWYGPIYATMQGLAPPRMRATTTALLLFMTTLIGLGLGPLALGALSDCLAGPVGLGPAEGLRWAMIAFSLMALIGSGLFLASRRTIAADLTS